MEQALGSLTVRARRQGLFEITEEIAAWVARQKVRDGLLTVFIRHTSASLLIQENASPAARRDVEHYFSRIAPEGGPYEHDDEGPDDMPAHLRAALTATQLSVPVAGGRLLLGTWQGIYLFEHRRNAPEREIALYVVGE
jgi:secondary thiamine-phosphate synthase enzyme